MSAFYTSGGGDSERLTDNFLDDFRILEFDVPEEREDFVDDGRLVQSIDDLSQTRQDVQRQLEIAGIALKHRLGLGQDHFADHLVV